MCGVNCEHSHLESKIEKKIKEIYEINEHKMCIWLFFFKEWNIFFSWRQSINFTVQHTNYILPITYTRDTKEYSIWMRFTLDNKGRRQFNTLKSNVQSWSNRSQTCSHNKGNNKKQSLNGWQRFVEYVLWFFSTANEDLNERIPVEVILDLLTVAVEVLEWRTLRCCHWLRLDPCWDVKGIIEIS